MSYQIFERCISNNELCVVSRMSVKDEMVDLLRRAGIAFSPSSTFDKIVEYFVKNGIYDVQTINLSLFEHGEDTLGD